MSNRPALTLNFAKRAALLTAGVAALVTASLEFFPAAKKGLKIP